MYSGVCGVAKLANGTTIRCGLRLAAIPNTQQRLFKLFINEPLTDHERHKGDFVTVFQRTVRLDELLVDGDLEGAVLR